MGLVYKVVNRVNGKVYVGKTTKTLAARRVDHLAIRVGRQVFQHALAKYGADNFAWEVLEEVPNEFLNDAERRWITALDATNEKLGYNRSLGGDGGQRTVPDSLETRRKKALGMIGNSNACGSRKTPMTEAHKRAIGLGRRGKRGPLSPAHRAAISKRMKGNHNNPPRH